MAQINVFIKIKERLNEIDIGINLHEIQINFTEIR